MQARRIPPRRLDIHIKNSEPPLFRDRHHITVMSITTGLCRPCDFLLFNILAAKTLKCVGKRTLSIASNCLQERPTPVGRQSTLSRWIRRPKCSPS